MSIHNSQVDNSNIDNNSGTGINLGDSSVLGSIGQGLEALALGSIVIDGTDTDPARAGGEFAYNSRDPVAKRVSTKIGGLPDTTLLSGAAVPGLVVGIHKLESIITRRQSTSFRDGDYNMYTGQFVIDPVTATDTFHKALSSSQYIDTAANSNRSNTGKMVYLVGAKPSSRSYDSKR
jgi:hypothetical protein